MTSNLSRRDFHKLTAAAVGGILAGTTLGCGTDEKAKSTKSPAGANAKHGTDEKDSATKSDGEVAANDWLGDKHVCRGLNACKNKGASGMNECAGRGTCASFQHMCGGSNDCKFQGGCGTDAGRNSCKQQGKCHVPLMEDAWKDARAAFVDAMKKAGKPVGDAPPAT
jgi:hypothetical protein